MDKQTHSKLGFFGQLAHDTANAVGSPKTFFIALLIVMGWALSGPFFDFSDTWQLIINTGTTIVTFLLVILLQHMQNHDSKAIHLKLDELIRSVKTARNTLVDLEAMTDEELEALHQEFQAIRAKAQQGGNRDVAR